MIDAAVIAEHGLSAAEYEHLRQVLGRAPNLTELGIFSVMWSEHCSYKSSRVWLRQLPTKGPQVLQGPGENAGIIRFDEHQALVFKMESHNHPSFIEPYQGAATGVGGILRDVFTMGARPIANLNALRFGAATHPKTPFLLRGVVAGIGGYGNCVGIPTVGGELGFDASFNGNILVNAMTVGIVDQRAVFYGRATGPGNPVLYVGSKTGRDGIHGATMASDVFGEGNEARRPTVQVGDPFTEKLLLEACLEAMQTDVVLGIQDMGAAGLTSSAFEMAARAGSGLALELDAVPQREPGMTAYEMLLSESQERMLLVVQAGAEEQILAIFRKWELDATVIGRVTDTGRVVARHAGQVVVDLPVAPVVDEAPRYERPQQRPAWQDAVQRLEPSSVPDLDDGTAVLLRLVGSPNLCARAWVWRQYDHQVGTDTVVLPGSDAAVLRVKGSARGIAVSTDCNSRYCYLDPYWGAAHAVAEAARNVVCSGAQPQAITDCLNFGNPENPAIMWQFVQAIDGIAEACRILETPVVSGNVSLYNETAGQAIFPTPMIGMVGILDDVTQYVTSFFQREGDCILLLGDLPGELGGSEYLAVIHGQIAGCPPHLDLARERAVQQACLAAMRRGVVRSAHDCADGGLAVTLAECALGGARRFGARVALSPPEGAGRIDALLFGEAPSRIVLSVVPDDVALVTTIAQEHCVPVHELGVVGGERLAIGTWVDIAVGELYAAWSQGFEQIVGR